MIYCFFSLCNGCLQRTSQSGVPPRFRREPPTDAGDTESQQNPSSTMVVSKSDNTTIGNMNEDMNNAIRRVGRIENIVSFQSD